MKQIIGTKVGMTSLFDASGKLIPVTVVHCDTNKVLEVKQHEGINLVKIGYKEKAEAKNNKAHNGIFKKLDLPTMETIKTLHSSTSYNVGDDINVDLFASGE
jgi:large subunit ribosomal protein L3